MNSRNSIHDGTVAVPVSVAVLGEQFRLCSGFLKEVRAENVP